MKRYNGDHTALGERRKNEFRTELGRRIRKLRQKRRLTQEHLAEQSGINAKYLGELERGIKNPTAVMVGKIAAALDSPVCSLLNSLHERVCPCSDAADIIGKLLAGRERREVRKAVRIIEALFEDEEA
ncbi:MAG: helix-turn-helix domain-containing protein [Nitrospirae bacterium]|nr:helix-turn-helix domain-containing protein [Nitrospirota bacterium]